MTAGPTAMRAPLGEHDLAHELIVRFVRAEAFAQPLIERVDALHADAVRIRAQQIGAFVRPEIGVERAGEQALDELRALVGRLIRDESGSLLRSGQRADGIERCAAQKLAVRARFRRKEPEPLELRISVLIDEVAHRQPGVLALRQQPIRGHGDLRIGHQPHEARDNHRLSAHLADADEPGFGHAGDLLFVRAEVDEIGYVADRAVGVMRAHEQALRGPFAVPAVGGENGKAAQRWLILRLEDRAAANPLRQQPIRIGIFVEALAAFVRHRLRRLQQQQALRGIRGENAPPAGVFHDLVEVRFGIEGEDREPETVLPVRLRMARARVAPRFAEHGQHVVHESGRRLLRRRLNLDRNLDALLTERRDERGGAGLPRTDTAAGLDCEEIGSREGDGIRGVGLEAIAELGGQADVRGFSGAKFEGRRLGNERNNRRRRELRRRNRWRFRKLGAGRRGKGAKEGERNNEQSGQLEMRALGSAGFQPALAGILPGSRTRAVRSRGTQFRINVRAAAKQDASPGRLEACAPQGPQLG